jgi:hypothetical protein
MFCYTLQCLLYDNLMRLSIEPGVKKVCQGVDKSLHYCLHIDSVPALSEFVKNCVLNSDVKIQTRLFPHQVKVYGKDHPALKGLIRARVHTRTLVNKRMETKMVLLKCDGRQQSLRMTT